ncbi:thioesterase family protein [Ammoniphilus sp. CFH 90114]|uniref:acyl-CoA thioesterase n=1 Tax=Ammoniphilus sp. CFH 90114 TaxID=2493665 RepID=UPI00100E7C59|nr:thioesterase family protein [Ammoniphilus sp. CFH 90114]RXT08025.1 acyl-CoA thioesterase [Ammoniphilus sp. CFH 90114]
MVENTVNLNVYWGDTDMAGIIYYPNYFKWFDIGWFHLFKKLGIAPKELMEEQKIAFPIIDVGCTFRKPLYYNDEIRVVTRVAEVNEKTFKLVHEVYRGEELTGKGHELRGWVKFDEGILKAYPIPDEVRRKLTQESVEVK